MIPQETYTKMFLSQCGYTVDEVNIKIYSKKWWFSCRANSLNLRLTKEGFEVLTNTLGISSYIVEFLEPIGLSSQSLIFLARYISCPYYIFSHTVLHVFDASTAAELYLFSNDISRYGLIKAINNRYFSGYTA